MQNDSNVENLKSETPDYLQCEPRIFKVTFDPLSDVCEIEFTIIIKCTDEILHEHNRFWSGDEDRLAESNNNIVDVLLKMIARKVFFACYEGENFVVKDLNSSFGINSIFLKEGWFDGCFEITKIYFDNYVDGSLFNFEKVLGN